MNSKQNAVFWIGLILIVANFWVSGQSTTFWQTFTVKGTSGLAGQTGTAKWQRLKNGTVHTSIPGVCPSGFIWNPTSKFCVPGK